MGKPWADKPFSLIATPTSSQAVSPQTLKVATEMTLVHNMMLRNLNAIHLQATSLHNSQDISDFLIFCQAYLETIRHHHSTEEEFFFPAIEDYTSEKGIMEGSLEQHKAFEAGVERFRVYVTETTPDTYDGKALRGIIDGFGEALAVHLRAEIQTLLGLEKYGPEKLMNAWVMLDKKVFSTIHDKYQFFPCGLGANDRTFENSKNAYWPPFPFFVPYLIHYWFARRHRGSWRFSPCTIFGQPKELPFVVED